MASVPAVTLHDGNRIPQLGLGVWRMAVGDTQRCVEYALEVGYRHIDTAALYANEREVGRAVRASGLPRDEVFVTTKLWNDRQGDPRAALEESLDRLGFDHVDLYLIHWPVPSQGLYVDAWRALAQARETGLTTSIGVSNFNVDHLDRIIRATGEVPVVNQIEIHPTFAQTALVAENTLRGIQTQGWRPLGAGRDLDSAAVTGVAAQTGRTPAQVVLRWHLQRGIIVFPKSVTPARIAQNLDVFDFTLTPAQMAALDDLDSGERMGLDPATM